MKPVSIPSRHFIEFLRIHEHSIHTSDTPKRGRLFKALVENNTDLSIPGTHATSVILVFDLYMPKAKAMREISEIQNNVAAFLRFVKAQSTRVTVMTKNIVDRNGVLLSNDLRNKVLLRVSYATAEEKIST